MSVALLHRNPKQPRTTFNQAALEELADSIRANGVLQPILVRPRPAGGYDIVAGERRYRAALMAGLKSVPVLVRELTDAEMLAVALIENLIREDIAPLETARAFQRLMSDFGWTQDEMGRRVGKSRPAVSNSLRLLELPVLIQQSLDRGEISEGHARALLGDRSLRDTAGFQLLQARVFKMTVDRALSVREVERLMRTTDGAAATSVTASADVSRETPAEVRTSANAAGQDSADRGALEDRLRDALGTKVRISGSDGRGRIEIEYFSADELDNLLTRIEQAFAPRAERIGRDSGGTRNAGVVRASARGGDA
jgi:ParB family chromosome partitioning protein